MYSIFNAYGTFQASSYCLLKNIIFHFQYIVHIYICHDEGTHMLILVIVFVAITDTENHNI